MPPKRRKAKVSKKKEKATAKVPSKEKSEKSGFSLDVCREWFQRLVAVDGDDGADIGPGGTMQLCEELDVLPENVIMLGIAWKLKCATMGTFKWEEWAEGMSNLQCDSVSKLKRKLPSLSKEIQSEPAAKELFRYGFDFARSVNENPLQRSLDRETASSMFKVLLRGKWTHLDRFLTYLEEQDVKVVNKDQWCSVYEFAKTINEDLSNYDPSGAWPILLDEYVEHIKSQDGPDAAPMNVS
eukprot:m.341021 g.341021  ORF g.341021 m.341021 type:complete len:240 (-) comp19735_c0_seq1:172-891(-)